MYSFDQDSYLMRLRGGLSKEEYDACGDDVPEPLFISMPYNYLHSLDTAAIAKQSAHCVVVSNIKWAVDGDLRHAQVGLADVF